MTGTDAQNESNRRTGAFVTNKWLVGVLVGLIISLTGYIFSQKDSNQEAQAKTLSTVVADVSNVRADVEAIKARENERNAEILRRLDRMERVLDAISAEVRRPITTKRANSD